MLRIHTRAVLAAITASVALVLLSGCGMSEAESVASQEAQLQKLVEQADAWGADIITQVPEAEKADVTGNIGGSRQASAMYEEWPKYYYWSQIVVLNPTARTPTVFADDLEPWLVEQGWVRNPDHEFPPGKETFVRAYQRGRYSLAVEVYTALPPQAQLLNFKIVTPETNPDSR